MENINFKKILEIIVNYFIEIFKYWGYVSDEDINEVKDFIDEIKA